MFGNNENKRFIDIHREGTFNVYKIIVDKNTGVNYLFVCEGNAGGITVLLDSEGKPVVTPITREY